MPMVVRVQIDPARLDVLPRGDGVAVLVPGSWDDAERVARALRGVEGLASAVGDPYPTTSNVFPPVFGGPWSIKLRDAEELAVRGTLAKMPPI